MKNGQSIKIKIDPVYVMFAGLGFVSIAIFISLRTALFVLCFLATAALFFRFFAGIYLQILSKDNSRRMTRIVVLSLPVMYNFLVSQRVNPKQLIYGTGNVMSGKGGLSVGFEIRNK
ncbi:hypothetical protein [Chryseolinea lacunae]|uniref:Uncharacterized protein n=1 Tax=Chryseolinea lacunae TaxID=2801331 RepID=A0ABS1KX91_9BACT|nr:hypothetical protein [Chryseolinea lacunae]MBL0743832.1 hypothetical protein [Chryseolinea lacunae]